MRPVDGERAGTACAPAPSTARSEATGPPAPRFVAGDVVAARFEILAALGRGGRGEVFAARDRELGEEVAIQLLRPDLAADAAVLARLKSEVLLARRISHPNVCRIHDLAVHAAGDRAEPLVLLSMERLRGPTLAEWLREHGRPQEAAARAWLADIAAGVDAAHAAGVIHGEIKPGNIILDRDRGAVVTDFGFAQNADEAAAGAATASGTPAYLAPEQLAGAVLTPAVDIYAFGRVAQALGPPGGKWGRLYSGCLVHDPAQRCASALAALAMLGPAGVPRPSRLRRMVLAAAGMALAIALYRYTRVRSQVAPGAELVLTPVVNATGDPQLDSATAVLRQQFAQSAQFQMTSDADIRQQLQRMGRPPGEGAAALAQQPALAREVAMRRGAPLVVFATLTRLAGRYRLELELERTGHDPDAAARRWSDTETAASKADLFNALHQAAVWVRRMAGEQAAALASTDQPPQDITTPSWEALAEYVRAEVERADGRTPAALALLREATATDGGFALAYEREGDILVSQARYDEGYRAYRTALALSARRRLSRREDLRLTGSYDSDMGNYRGAVAAFRAYAALYPRDYLGAFYQGWPELQLGHPALALAAWHRAERLAPASPVPAENIAYAETWLGDGAAADGAAARAARLGGELSALRLEARAAFAAGRFDQGFARLDRLDQSSNPRERDLAVRMRASAQAELGKYAAAQTTLRRGLAAASDSPDRADIHLDLAYLALKLHRYLDVGRETGAALGLDTSPGRVAAAGALLAQAGDTAAARRTLRRLRPDRDMQPLADNATERLQGEILLAERRPQAALTALRAAANSAGATDDNTFLARALLAAGQIRAARDLYAAWADAPGKVWFQSQEFPPGWVADLAFQAAKLSDQLRLPDARARWQRYLELRADADADLPEVAFARTALNKDPHHDRQSHSPPLRRRVAGSHHTH